MAVSPLPLLPWAGFGADSVDGAYPNALGKIHFYDAGLASERDTYTGNSTADPVHTNPVVLDADGRPPSPIYIYGAYTIDVCDANDVSLYTIDYAADVGAMFAQGYGTAQAAGSKGVTSSPYVVLSTDRTISIDSTTNPFIVTLPDVTTWAFPLFVLNESDSVSGGPARLTPQAGQTINYGIQGTSYFSLAASSSTVLKWAQLIPDAANSNWLCFSNAE